MKSNSSHKKASTEVHRLRPSPLPNDQIESHIIEFVEDYLQRIDKTVAAHEMLFKNGLPQRCLKHNNILSLYCQTERLPLCVSCMYHGSDHKGHKVVPLKNASKQLATDTQNYRNKLQKRIERIEDVIRISTENLVKIERIYPQLCSQIEANFRGLYERLQRKQLEQLKQLFERTERLRSNHLVLIEEYNKLICYYIEKDPPVIKDDEQTQMYSRNVLNTILECVRYEQVQVKPIDFFDYPQSQSETFKDIENYLIERLETARFPEIIKLQNQRINLMQSMNISVKDQQKQKLSSKGKALKPDLKLKFSPRFSKTPERSRSFNGSFRMSTSRDIGRSPADAA